MAKDKTLSRYTYEVERSLAARVRQITREREGLYGIDQPSHPRKKKGGPKPKAKPENSGQPPGENGEEAEFDIVSEIEGTGIRGSPFSGDEIERTIGSTSPVRQSGESRLSYLRRWKRWRARKT